MARHRTSGKTEIRKKNIQLISRLLRVCPRPELSNEPTLGSLDLLFPNPFMSDLPDSIQKSSIPALGFKKSMKRIYLETGFVIHLQPSGQIGFVCGCYPGSPDRKAVGDGL